MKSFLFALVLLTLVISLTIVYFRDQIGAAALDALIQITKTDIAPADESADADEKIAEPAPLPEPKWVPEGFRGPTGEPKIIGPKSNPPNY